MKNHYIGRALFFNPIVVLLYFIFCSVLLDFFEYGGTSRRVPTLILIAGSLFIWFLLCPLFRKRIHQRVTDQTSSIRKISVYWFWFAIVSLIGMTIYTGVQTYEISQSWGTPLHRRIREWRTQTTIDLEETNVIEQGLDGLLAEIDEEINLPEVLYSYSTVEVEFNRAGDIESLYMPIMGENEEGLFESFLITSTDKMNQLTVLRNEPRASDDTDEDWLLSPLIDTLNQLSIEEIIQEWPEEDSFGIYYAGYRTWGYNNSGIYYMEDEGPVVLEDVEDEIIGYTVSIFVSGKTDDITPMRFIDRSLSYPAEMQALEAESDVSLGYQVDEHQQEVYFLTEELGYRLAVIDAATGSRWYGLEKTEDGGEVWETVNLSPFGERSGVTSGIKFFDEEYGFAILGNTNQTAATLFRTDDGGQTFEPIRFPSIEVPLNDEDMYNPFQFPETPYEENGSLYVLVGQGPHGDYNLGAKALYRSEDNGMTWEFVEEVDGNND